MNTGQKIWRGLSTAIAVVVIITSIAGIVGAWWAHNTVTNVTLRAFTIVDTAVGVVDAGASRVNDLVQRGRNEVQQIESTIVTVGDNIAENKPVLTALSNRINERLAPPVEQVRTILTPIISTVRAVRALIDFVNAIPFIRETPPGIDDLENALNRLDETIADVRQINDTVRATVTETTERFTNESAGTLTGLTGRVDSRLADTQAAVEATRAEIAALQGRLAAQRARLLLIYNLIAIGLTLFLLWVIYSQIVVMRRPWRKPSQHDEGTGVAVAALAGQQEQETAIDVTS